MSNFDSTDTFMADRALKEQNRRLIEDLEECKSQLNELLQEDNKVSDATIKNGYLTLCGSIENWIGSVSHSEEEDFFNTRFKVVLQEEWRDPQGRLADLNLLQDSNEYDTRSRDWLDLLGSQDSSNCVVLSVVIWNHLDSNVFKEKFPVGTMKDAHFTVGRTDGGSNDISVPGHATLLEDIVDVMEEKYQSQGRCLKCPQPNRHQSQIHH